MGRVKSRQVGKILLTGAAGGFVEPFMGFGQIPSILSGIYAAESIITGKDYNKMTAWFNKHYDNSLILREYANTMDNDKFDKLISLLNLPLFSNLAANTNLPVLGIAAKAVQFMNFIKKPITQKR